MERKTKTAILAIAATTLVGAILSMVAEIAQKTDYVPNNEIVVVYPGDGSKEKIYTQGQFTHSGQDNVKYISTKSVKRSMVAQGYTQDAVPIKVAASADISVDPSQIESYLQNQSPSVWMGEIDDTINSALKSFVSVTPAADLIRPTEEVNNALTEHLNTALQTKGMKCRQSFITGHYAKDGEKMPNEREILMSADSKKETPPKKPSSPDLPKIEAPQPSKDLKSYFSDEKKCAEEAVKTEKNVQESKKNKKESESDNEVATKAKPKACKG